MTRKSIILAAGLAAALSFTSAPAAETVVASDPVGDGPVGRELADPTVDAAVGLDVTELAIVRNTDSLTFIVRLAELESPPPNEVIRYLWQMSVDDNPYWIQGKMSDLSTATATADDPAGTATRLTGAFRLRGNCGVVGVVSSCKHLLWLDGTFDTEANEVRMTVPLGTTVAPHFDDGGLITYAANQVMTASVQAVVSNATTSDTVEVIDEYSI